MAVDSTGNAYVTGWTFSTDFPTTPSAFARSISGPPDAFMTELNSAGSGLLRSSYLGGSGFDEGLAITVSRTGFPSVTGITDSTDFPMRGPVLQNEFGGLYDAFVATFFGGSLIFSTYIGGSDLEQPSGIATDIDFNLYVTGVTRSPDFPTTAGAWSRTLGGPQDAFVAKLPTFGGHLAHSTFLGGSDRDDSFGIAVGWSEAIYVVGGTFSSDFPTTPGAVGGPVSPGVFVTRLNPSATALDYSTYLGSGGANGIALDPLGNAYVTGGAGPGFPVTPGVFGPEFRGGGDDAFVARLALADASELTVINQVLNDNGGTKTVGDFQVRVDGNPFFTSGVPRVTFVGAHRLSVDPVPGYAPRFGGDCATDGSITLGPGDIKTCTVTNDDIAPQLTVTKIVVNDSGRTRQVGDFPLFIDGVPILSGVRNALNAGAHTVGETSSARLRGDMERRLRGRWIDQPGTRRRQELRDHE